MIAVLYAVKTAVSALIVILVGLAFVPHWLGSRLTDLQKLLTDEIDRRERRN